MITNKKHLLHLFDSIKTYWDPHVVADLNGQSVKLAKFKGAFDWHSHEKEDELFFVLKGSFHMHFRDRTETLETGDLIVVNRGVEHKPEADSEAWVMMFEPSETLNTGNTITDKTVKDLKRL